MCLVRFLTHPWAESTPSPWTQADLVYAVQAGAITGLVVGLMEFALAWGRPPLRRAGILLQDGLREWLARTLGAAILLVVLGGGGWKLVLLAWLCPDYGREFCHRLTAQAWDRERAALEVPLDQNGYIQLKELMGNPYLGDLNLSYSRWDGTAYDGWTAQQSQTGTSAVSVQSFMARPTTTVFVP